MDVISSFDNPSSSVDVSNSSIGLRVFPRRLELTFELAHWRKILAEDRDSRLFSTPAPGDPRERFNHATEGPMVQENGPGSSERETIRFFRAGE